MSTNDRFTCGACGKSYGWKPELAGKRAKCKCGQVIEVPAHPAGPEHAAAAPPAMDDLYALANDSSARAVAEAPRCPSCMSSLTPDAVLCVSCGFNLRTGTKLQPSVESGHAPPAGKAPAGRRSQKALLPGGRGTGREEAANDAASSAPIMDLYVPLALLMLGSTVAIWRIMGSGDLSFASAFALFGVWITFESIIVFGGCLIAVKFMGISLGEPLKAALKVIAVVVGPFGIGLLASWMAGTWVVGFLLAPVLYFALLSKFFDMDLGEVLTLSGIIYAVQYFGRLMLLFTLLRALFGSVPAPVAQIAGMSLFGPHAKLDEPDSTAVQGSAQADDKLTADLLENDKRTQEAQEFLSNPNNDLSETSRDAALSLVKDLYAKGAVKVMVNGLEGFVGKESASFTAGLLIVELPSTASERKALIDKYNSTQSPRGYKEAKDVKQKYLRFWAAKKHKKAKSDSGGTDV